MYRIVLDPCPPIPECSPLLQDFLVKCFDKDPRRRPSARALQQHLWLAIATKAAVNDQETVAFAQKIQRQNVGTLQWQNQTQEQAHSYVKSSFSQRQCLISLVSIPETEDRSYRLPTLSANDHQTCICLRCLRVDRTYTLRRRIATSLRRCPMALGADSTEPINTIFSNVPQGLAARRP